MELILIRAINWFADVIVLMLFVQAICSWFVGSSQGAMRLYRTLEQLTEPIVAPCRRILSGVNTGAVDFSVFLAFFLVRLIARVLIIIVSVIF